MKVLGTSNPADLMTKYLTREKVDNAIDKIGQVVQSGRADSSLDIQGKVYHVMEKAKEEKVVEAGQRSSTADGGARAPFAEPDRWENQGKEVVRFHSQPRRSLFAVRAKYKNSEKIGPIKTTRAKDQAGNEFILHDYWRASRRPQRQLPFQWTGTTTFHGGEDPRPSSPRWSACASSGRNGGW